MTECKHCRGQIHQDDHGTWIDNTGGDVCGWDGGNEPHEPEHEFGLVGDDIVRIARRVGRECSVATEGSFNADADERLALSSVLVMLEDKAHVMIQHDGVSSRDPRIVLLDSIANNLEKLLSDLDDA